MTGTIEREQWVGPSPAAPPPVRLARALVLGLGLGFALVCSGTVAAVPASATATARKPNPLEQAQRRSAARRAHERRIAHQRRVLTRALRRNPRLILRRGMLRKASHIGIELPLTIRLNPMAPLSNTACAALVPPRAPGCTGPVASNDALQIQTANDLTPDTSTIAGTIHATGRFAADTSGYGELGVLELHFGDVALTGTGFRLTDPDVGAGCVDSASPLQKTGPVSIVAAPPAFGDSFGYFGLFSGKLSFDLRTRFSFNSLVRDCLAPATPLFWTNRLEGPTSVFSPEVHLYDFAADLEGWTQWWTSPAPAWSTAQAHSGTGSLALPTSTTDDYAGVWQGGSPVAPLLDGGRYKVSMWVYFPNPGTYRATFSNGQSTWYGGDPDGGDRVVATSDSWEQFSWTATTPVSVGAGEDHSPTLRVSKVTGGNFTGETLYFDEIRTELLPGPAPNPPVPLSLRGRFALSPALTLDNQVRLGKLSAENAVQPQSSTTARLHYCSTATTATQDDPAPRAFCDGTTEDVSQLTTFRAASITAEVLIGNLAR